MRLFAERLLVDRTSSAVPEPHHYDAELSVSVTESGVPFVEACANPALVTLTEAEGEGETQICLMTRKLTDSESLDRLVAAGETGWATTFTKERGEAPDAPVMTASGPAPWSVDDHPSRRRSSGSRLHRHLRPGASGSAHDARVRAVGHHEDSGAGRGPGPLILVLTNRQDYTADWLVLELHRRKAEFVRFNTEDWPTAVGLSWRADGSGELRFATRTVSANDVGSVWYRRPVAPVMAAELDAERARWATAEAGEAMNGFWLTLDAMWVNPPLAEAAASSKPEQLRRAQRHGLAVPETLITNDGDEAQEFAQGLPTICKPLSPGAVVADGVERSFFTRLLSADDVQALAEQLGQEPYLLQHSIPKQYDIRVTVIGEEVFPVAIHSQVSAETETDWRVGDATQLRHSWSFVV